MPHYSKISLYLFLFAVCIGFSQKKQDSTLEQSLKNRTTGLVKNSKSSSIPIETMFGNRRINYLSILNIPVESSRKFSYFSIISVASPYDQTYAPNELIISNALTFKLIDKLFATGGLQYHFLNGIVPISGFQFLSKNAKWLYVLNSSIAFARDIRLQNVGIVEFKPRLSDLLKLYTRLQGIYNLKLKNRLHERSLVYLRTGLTIQKTSLGVGYNLDFYGPNKTIQENFGIFIHHLL